MMKHPPSMFRTATPKGFPLIARGSAYPRHPGYGHILNINPNGVASSTEQPGLRGNPVGVEFSFSRLPRVARVRATPGYKRKPLWGFQSRNVSAYGASPYRTTGQRDYRTTANKPSQRRPVVPLSRSPNVVGASPCLDVHFPFSSFRISFTAWRRLMLGSDRWVSPLRTVVLRCRKVFIPILLFTPVAVPGVR